MKPAALSYVFDPWPQTQVQAPLQAAVHFELAEAVRRAVQSPHSFGTDELVQPRPYTVQAAELCS